MDQNIKNRLVGVVVIFALAVIFLPMILDGSGVRKDKLEVIVPPQPLVSANPEFEQKIVELQAQIDSLPDLTARHVDENSAGATDDPVTGNASDKGSAATAKSQPGTQTASNIEDPPPIARTGGDSWVLQVGSFQDRDKALAQRDKLRKSNIAAVFIEQFEIDDKPSYRVRLGPFLNRDQTRVAQNKIKAKHNIDGIIMKYER